MGNLMDISANHFVPQKLILRHLPDLLPQGVGNFSLPRSYYRTCPEAVDAFGNGHSCPGHKLNQRSTLLLGNTAAIHSESIRFTAASQHTTIPIRTPVHSDLELETMATSSPFSYAQAAKGQAAQAAAATSNEVADIRNKSIQDAASQAVSSKDGIEDKAGENATVSADSKADAAQGQSQAKDSASRETESESNTPFLTGLKREDGDAPVDDLSQGGEKRTVRSSSTSTRVTDDSDFKKGQRKGRKGKAPGSSAADSDKVKDKEDEKETESPKVELTEAPLPLVNIWTQRKEAQAAKLKNNTAADASAGSTTSSAPQDAKKRSKAFESGSFPKATQNGHHGGFKGQRKAGEDGRTESDVAVRRGAARGSRVAEKADTLPPAADASAWPTPETAVREEKRKPTDRVEKPEPSESNEEHTSTKTKRKEQWERIDFVPTVNWETPVPALRGSRGGRGGGSGRGGRDVTSRGGAHAASSASVSTDKPADAAPAAASKSTNDQRDKARDGAPSNRGNTLPSTVTRQSGTEAPRHRDHRKPSGPPRGDRAKDATSTPSTVSLPQIFKPCFPPNSH